MEKTPEAAATSNLHRNLLAICVKPSRHRHTKGEYRAGRHSAKSHHRMGTPEQVRAPLGESAGSPSPSPKFYRQPRRRTCGKDLANWRGRDFTPRNSADSPPGEHPRKGVHLSLTMNEEGPRDRRHGGSQRNAVPSSVNAPFYLSLEPGNSTRSRSALCPTRCRRHQTVSRISATQSAGRFTFRRGRFN